MTQETPKNNSKEVFDYESYKKTVVKDDISKMKNKLKPYWWENFPILGPIIYSIRIQLKYTEIDRGILRKNIFLLQLIFLFGLLIIIDRAFFMITPWFYYLQINLGIKRTEKALVDEEEKEVANI